MNIIYLILVHKNPRQFTGLVQSLSDNESSFVIHVDKKVSAKGFKSRINKASVPNVHFLRNRLACCWGSYNLIQATLNGLKYIQKKFSNNDRIVLLSGQDYPIKSTKDINLFFDKYPNTIFLDYSMIPKKGWFKGGIHRFPYFDKIKHILPLYGGSQWLSFPVWLLKYIFGFLRANPDFIFYFKSVEIPDESFFQTLLLNIKVDSVHENIKNNNLHLINWSQSCHPDILTDSDKGLILDSKCLFARKFHPIVSRKLIKFINHNIIKKT